MSILIETKRLVLRKITLDYKEDMFAMHSDSEVQKFTGEPVVESIKDLEKGIRIRLEEFDQYGFGRLAVILKETNEFVGWAGLAYLPEFDKIDLGYRLKKEFWGCGIATESSKAIIDYAFNTLNLDLIIAIALPENKASIRVMQKVGMVFDKQAPYDEHIQNAIWYKLDRKTYLDKRD